MVMILFFLLFLAQVLAADFDFVSPDSVEQKEEFTVSINFETQENYDVKIFVHNSEDEKIEREEYLSEIDNDGWKDSWFYLKEAFPDKKEYDLRVTGESGEELICVRLRKSGADSFETLCKQITVISQEKDEEVQEPEENKKEEVETPSEETVQNDTNIEEKIQPLLQPKPEVKEEKIILNKKQIKEEPKILVTKQQSIRNAIVYSFLLVCIAIIVLLSLKKL